MTSTWIPGQQRTWVIQWPRLLETRDAWAKEVRKSSPNGLAHLRHLVSSVFHESQGLENIRVRSYKAQEAKETHWASEVTSSTRSRSQKQQNNCLWLPGSTVRWTSFQLLFLMIKRCWKKITLYSEILYGSLINADLGGFGSHSKRRKKLVPLVWPQAVGEH